MNISLKKKLTILILLILVIIIIVTRLQPNTGMSVIIPTEQASSDISNQEPPTPDNVNHAPMTIKSTPTQESTKEHTKRLSNPDVVFDLTVDGGKLIKGPSQITVNRGQSVRININAVSEEVNAKLEGYEIITESYKHEDPPGGFRFVADKTGSFKFYAFVEDETNSEGSDLQVYLGTVTVK